MDGATHISKTARLAILSIGGGVVLGLFLSPFVLGYRAPEAQSPPPANPHGCARALLAADTATALTATCIELLEHTRAQLESAQPNGYGHDPH